VNSNNEIQGYKAYPMLHFHRKFSSGVTTAGGVSAGSDISLEWSDQGAGVH